AYLDFNFGNYDFSKNEVNNNLSSQVSEPSIETNVFELIKGKLTDAIYLEEKFEKVVNAHTELTDSIVDALNYKKTGDVYFSRKFYSLTEALNHLIAESDFENKLYSDVMGSSSVRSCLHGLQSEFRVFQIERGTY
ncbi:hypothetical protein M9195_09295, partial [Apilactobacillus sp. F1]|nr:hypothetical protein [Apilactobacillus sp. F1]